jgi:hypothetical protein
MHELFSKNYLLGKLLDRLLIMKNGVLKPKIPTDSIISLNHSAILPWLLLAWG